MFHCSGNVKGRHSAKIEIDFHSNLAKKVETKNDVVVAGTGKKNACCSSMRQERLNSGSISSCNKISLEVLSSPARVCPVRFWMTLAMAPGGRACSCIKVLSDPVSKRTRSGNEEDIFVCSG